MRTLLLMRGAPGSGKSTWIKENGLSNYVLEPDKIRMMCSSPQLTKDGEYVISQENDDLVWKTLFEILEKRMENGEFTVIDATNSKTKDMTRYKDLCSQYRYRIYCVDFTDIPLETCLKQNKMREPLKWVPENAIKNIYARFETQKVPTGINVIRRDELYKIYEQPFDLSQYKKVIHFGDIHGCYDTLMQYFNENPFNDEYEYIFCGDYIDRGNQNGKTIKFLMSIMDKPNVCLLEGNHERSLYLFGHDVPSYSKEFEKKTKYDLINEGITSKDARMFYRKVRQCSYYTYNGINVLVCHGGVPYTKENILFIPTHNLIKGVGKYEDVEDVVDQWMSNSKSTDYLIHGHRNIEGLETQVADRVFNLEGGVEFGGKLRVVELNNDLTWKVIELDNIQPNKEEELEIKPTYDLTNVEDVVKAMRENSFIDEKPLGDNISSFNFTRQAFLGKNWDNQTIKARGLFINTKTNEIVARSYEKFFRIGETRDTELPILKQKLVFPVYAYVKENGFLAIVSYNKEKDDLFVASKSTNKGDYVNYINAQLEPYRENILSLYRGAPSTNFSLVFECIDKDNDPHIIEYKENKLVLLDAIFNDMTFRTFDYETLLYTIGNGIGCPVKELAYTLNDWDEFRDLYYKLTNPDNLYQYEGEYIEGFVFVDSVGFMTKCKSEYYNSWKKLRGISDQVLRTGNTRKTGSLQTPIENKFFGFLKRCFNEDRDKETKSYPYKTDIISLRNKFEREYK